uniref:uncharacterized protein LOC120341083 n=1 Tax=Styela clava TaxID=7725 RepID=UPI00193A3035|nr:uncharacterized protein LOC120341083 [Styela clava]
MITEEQREASNDVVTDSTMAEATTQDAITEPKTGIITEEQKETTTDGVTDSTIATTLDATTDRKNCDVTYDSKCFYIVVFGEQNVSFNNAKSLCGKNNHLTNIYALEHYRQLRDCLRSKIPTGKTWVTAWTGLTYEVSKIYSYAGVGKIFGLGAENPALP